MKTFVIGDIHGAHRALMQCLERCKFDRERDRLIALGDVCDGYPEVDRCIAELLTLKHCDYIVGNHDLWALDWALEGKEPDIWTSQGGAATIFSYGSEPMPEKHKDFLQKAHHYFVLEERIFIHGGFDPNFPLEKQGLQKFVWDRDLIYAAWEQSQKDNAYKFSSFQEIFLGHTPVQNFKSNLPQHFCNIWAVDTGAGWSGPLTIMDIHSKEYWQSEPTSKLYEGIRSR